MLWIQLISQFNFRRQAIHKVRIKSIWNFFLKQHLPKSCIYCSVIPTKKLLSLLGLKFSSRFIFKWESQHKKSVVNWDWENDIFSTNQKTPHRPFILVQSYALTQKRFIFQWRFFKGKLKRNEVKCFLWRENTLFFWWNKSLHWFFGSFFDFLPFLCSSQ